MEWYIVFALFFVGIFVGFINTLAGSGSLISLPLLMFFGLSANVANGTNRIAILLQSIVAVANFKQKQVFTIKESLWLTVPAIIGSIPGAFLAVKLNETIMNYTIGILLIVMFFIILLKPEAWIKKRTEKQMEKPGWLQIMVLFLIGMYGGFIQISAGVFLLAGLVLSAGLDVVKANAFKLLIVLAYTPFVMIIFIINDQVNYLFGLILALGNGVGAWVASNYAVRMGGKFVRYLLLLIVLLSALELFGLFELLFSQF